ncbi:MAG: GTPase HflX [bacterium]
MAKIHGELNGLKPSQIKTLEKLYKRRVGSSEPVTQDFATQLTLLSKDLNRVVAALIDRQGNVEHVMIGDSERVYLPDIGRSRAGAGRFRGIRLVRTYLGPKRGVELSQDDVTDLSKLQLDAVVSVRVGPGGYPGETVFAHLIPPTPDGQVYQAETYTNPAEVDVDFQQLILELEAEFQRKAPETRTTEGAPTIVVYVATPNGRSEDVELAELYELCRTAGVNVVDTVVQRRQELHPKWGVGRGKIEEINLRALQLGVDLLVFGQDLTPGQMRAITDDTDLRLIDRTQLILDIFAQHATTADGKLQVELAQLKYNLPRLSNRNTGMSRLTGGIGGRGPGETKLEINRRRANDRIRQLEKDIEKLSTQRQLRRHRRLQRDVPVVAIVGYTNAGKSTLLNQLTQSQVLSEDKLFATLQPTSRRLRFPDDREIIFTDTVGFIHDLPADLVAAFKATLEELEEADVLLHLVDASDEEFPQRIKAVNRILADLGLEKKEQILVFNKSDRLAPAEALATARQWDAIAISALKRQTTLPLIEELETRLFQQSRQQISAQEPAAD